VYYLSIHNLSVFN